MTSIRVLRSCWRWSCLVLLTIGSTRAAEPPVIPVGLDAYRMWERWPCQRIGARAYMRSTYDRRGGNESADASRRLSCCTRRMESARAESLSARICASTLAMRVSD